jgi:DNA-binding transcriptional MerR regulator
MVFMRIGELSKNTGVSIATIRLYEREGLIDPASRTVGKFREFNPGQERRLDFIKRVRNVGFSLDEVKALLALADATDGEATAKLTEQVFAGISSRERDLAQLKRCLQDAQASVVSFADIDWAFRPR